MKIYSFDIDGTICSNTYGEYEKAIPYQNRILSINNLYKKGNTIKLFTARGTTTGTDWEEITKKQLSSWGVFYHKLIFGKPEADIFVDDKAFNDKYWLWEQSHNLLDESLKPAFDFFSETAIAHSHIAQDSELLEKIKILGNEVSETLIKGGTIFLAGNGGSFSDSQHIAAEFVGKLNHQRIPLASIALGTNLSSVTAIANDFGYDQIFSRELEALGSEKDYLIALSTSGESKNIIKLLETAKLKKIKTALLTGPKMINKASKLCDLIVHTPSEVKTTAGIQQIHIAIGHFICEMGQANFIGV